MVDAAPVPPAVTAVTAVTVKLPPFWPRDPAVWFLQAESQFAIRGVTQEITKYHHLVASLDQDTACRVVAILQNPPAVDPYSALKKQLVKTFTLSEHERARRLLHLPPLGDRTPSELMDMMLALYGSPNPDFLFRSLFLEKLPEAIRCHLVQMDTTDCRELALRADALMSTRGLQMEVHSVSRPHRGQQQKAGQPNKKQQLCTWHAKYGSKARRCAAPCSYTPAALNEVSVEVERTTESGNAWAGHPQ